MLSWRIHLFVSCGESGTLLRLRFGPLRLQLYPPKPKKTLEEKKQRPAKAKKDKKKKDKLAKKQVADREEDSGMDLDFILSLAELGLKALQDLRDMFRVDELYLRLYWSREDPADTAISYGYAEALMASLLNLVESQFTVRRCDTRILLDFEREKVHVLARLHFSLCLGSLLGMGLRAGFDTLRIFRAKKKKNTRQGRNPAV